METQSTAASPRTQVLLNRKVPPFLPPAAAETADVLDLKSVTRMIRPGQDIVSEGRRCSAIFLIVEGIAIRYRILRDGQRQILNFLLPGDFAGVASCRFDCALYSIKPLTHAAIAPIPLPRLIGLFDTHPRLVAKLFWSLSAESTIMAEHLIAVGRRSASERIAHFMLELYFRLQHIGMADECSFRLPLTQEMISDALGLSIPYVNRVLRQLRDDGLVRIKDQVVAIDDIDGLSALADFEGSYLEPLSITDLLAGRA